MTTELVDWSLALLPVLLMVGLFVWLDVFKLMSLREILALLALGGVVALITYPISGRVIDTLPLGFSFYSRFVAPWIEEALKGVAVALLIARNRIGFKLDAVISGFAIGAGFSVVENIFYLLRFPELQPSVWMVRGLGTALMHGATCAILAATAHELAERATRRKGANFRLNPGWFLPGLLIAGLLHTTFNQFPERPLLAMLGALIATPLVLMAIFHWGANEARGWLESESADHRAALEAMRGGGYPADASGQRIAALAERSGAAAGALIRDYLHTALTLVVAAEEKLLGSPQTLPSAESRAAFDRLDSLRRQIGRTGFAALDPLLPLSRNDRWEMSELREDVRREG